MKRWNSMPHPVDAILLAAAVVVWSGALAGTLRQHPERPARRVSEESLAPKNGYEASAQTAVTAGRGRWRRPAGMSGLAARGGDLFTAPAVPQERVADWRAEVPAYFFDEDEATPASASDAVELLAVERCEERFHLGAVVGGPGSYVVVLRESGSGESVVLRLGETDARHGVTVKAVAVDAAAARAAGVGEKEPTLASAVLLDQRTGQEFTATAGSTPSARLVARVRCPPEGDVRELGEGMTFSAGGSLYSVIKLERDPPTAVLERAQKSESPHRVVLAAKTAPAPGGASSPNATSLSAPSPATNSNELPKPTILLRRADLPGDGANQPGGS